MNLNKIYLRIIQKKGTDKTAQGFMLVEVLVGIILTLILVQIAMQVVVMATAVKIHGDELTDATQWIQEDIEDIKKKANEIDAVDANVSPIAYTSPTRCNVSSTSNGYANLLMTTSRATSLNGTTIAASADFTKTSSSGTRTYKMRREAVISTVSPYNVLQLTYKVSQNSDTSFTSPILTSYSEVIPGASFSCK